MTCEHPQCCICLKRECQDKRGWTRFQKYGSLYVCSESCIRSALNVAYHAACTLGCPEEKPCGKEQS